ncbi:dTDP-4-dehydrorhamnose 3,5-epimerase family protein [Leptospira sp. 2 VSF19]|uniref:dTDP-4-dehydrorhamnose 3,5-epimerase family protein n=1 Tax=Leptospira soteropolitanensis TaxID=2950025 RepID=A0AAW5VHE6_9LEPT|nr:dTDP-4-dehydrorhamnose 3,5-epimerase family protein [Leptospira soteropolitanensis]MCW7493174.1 dTDP-4-dehydrorhamnose 3,5-epimerase family protein [Leptospira soteropolitanensis]MCW7500757.1 dTDP-4-dehydrorhamnose 3,5-epimerase family protein [Leptospira soteropolitanensis]MCW7523024.1 dTDP-4-dehydrorhamnose 3,5-epimerase family protein [Leptospira soteropolitanensis]MCW7526869.1 dTDP-4-dehydrorhamnose 3,5-epimerase family protein [Leptospira soteropolitanensis]MCW7530742.1 dTDP-4-dehydror
MIFKDFEEMQDITVTSLSIIKGLKGDVRHAMKKSDSSFTGFGEAYFSTIKNGEIKGWKRHNQATLNLVLAFGEVVLFAYDDRPTSKSYGFLAKIVISLGNYKRLTIGPGLWVAFSGSEELSAILNICDLEHDPSEADNREIGDELLPDLRRFI